MSDLVANPILEGIELKNPRKVDCPLCGTQMTEEINPYYHAQPLDTVTFFLCNRCNLWICGCCGGYEVAKENRGIIKLSKPAKWQAEIDQIETLVRAQQ